MTNDPSQRPQDAARYDICGYETVCLQPRWYHASDGGNVVHHPFMTRDEFRALTGASREAVVANVFGAGNEPDPEFRADLDAFEQSIRTEERAARSPRFDETVEEWGAAQWRRGVESGLAARSPRDSDLEAALDVVRNALWRHLGGRSARAQAINVAFTAAINALGPAPEPAHPAPKCSICGHEEHEHWPDPEARVYCEPCRVNGPSDPRHTFAHPDTQEVQENG